MILQGTEILTSFIHIVSESLLAPVVIVLVIFLIYAILSFGGFLNEWFTKKPLKSAGLEKLLQDISSSDSPEDLKAVIDASALYKEQKEILVKITDNYNLGPEARKAFASKLIEEEESNLLKLTTKTDILVRLGPIFGLLGTLIPLGPGLSALGTGDITTLAQSLTIAFDTTVTGLTIGALGYIVSKYRKQWYESDLTTTETIAEAILEKLNQF
ncbi:MotA/TolQ/ExbB proton channel family protein [Methanobrevibacter ruminantium M1]|uniref:MotA/TolQ/ExbB proton channel family protein n=1 Tax=Methanobrevibacter ruminantium (strain ATCC 35063 / DSM 1093 / JCM 13430 / OCM 146 / M1) TaxID=634498 RepID=D3E005_METRM|nr:MotA/TolQ/ExbB proton channel family protein [Methanobrevibacter ruminantium]ADC46181.1 MotA/TolQ/ExbB proton channel family protein [Methanobrevibacter ruminantium M1]